MNKQPSITKKRNNLYTIYPRKFFIRLLKTIDNTDDEEILNAFQNTTYKALQALIEGEVKKNNSANHAQINNALEDVRDKAFALCKALENLDNTGDGFKYLMEFPHPLPSIDTHDSDMAREAAMTDKESEAYAKENPYNKDRKNPSRMAIDYFLQRLRGNAILAIHRSGSKIKTAGERINVVNEEWYENLYDFHEKRGAERKIPNMHHLRQFIISFKPFWDQYITHPFTEGRNHPESGQTISLAVDVIESIIGKIDPKIERSSIVTCIRNLRKEGKIEGAHAR